mgnify:CR=1 FL=1
MWRSGTPAASPLSLAQLRQSHGSVPANPLLAEPLYLAPYIERLGTGTADMIRRCREAGIPEPEFRLDDGFRLSLGRSPFKPAAPGTGSGTKEQSKEETTALRQKQADAGSEDGTRECARLEARVLAPSKAPRRPAKARDQILALMRTNPAITTVELASALNLSDSGVEYNLRKLRQQGRIRREGSTKAGRWRVLPPIQEPKA